jgi:drug/metabolite transporter (DMT)-like permease
MDATQIGAGPSERQRQPGVASAIHVRSGTFMIVTCILLSTIFGVVGQLLLKRGMTLLGAQTLSPSTILDVGIRIATSPWVILGIGIYVTGTFFWLVALSRVELSFAYPFASLSYVLIVGSSWLLLGESISPLRLAGVATICLGVLFVAQS